MRPSGPARPGAFLRRPAEYSADARRPERSQIARASAHPDMPRAIKKGAREKAPARRNIIDHYYELMADRAISMLMPSLRHAGVAAPRNSPTTFSG